MAAQHLFGWSPDRIWLFVVGTLEWKYEEYFSPFPQQNRRDAALVAFFRAQGIPDAQIVYLQDSQATSKRIEQALEKQLAMTRAGDLFVLYYCGHGSKNDNGSVYFASYDTDGEDPPPWMADTILSTIERGFGGSHALLMVDCCYSGYLADALPQPAKRIAYACLASSLASELSTGNWTFTEGLLLGLQGQAFVDADGNSSITLRELAAQIAESMAFAEEQISTFTATTNFDPNIIVAAARPRIGPRVGQRVEAYDGSDWYRAQIVDARGSEFKVHYYGYEESDDEWVTADRMREVSWTRYPVGAAIEVQWKRKWYPATVLDVRGGIHYIQYEDYDESWNEWVASKRIRPSRTDDRRPTADGRRAQRQDDKTTR